MPASSAANLHPPFNPQNLDPDADDIDENDLGELRGVPLPDSWPDYIKSGVLHALSIGLAVSLEKWRLLCTSEDSGLRLFVDNERLIDENARLRQIQRIKDARMSRVPQRERPRYTGTERLEILEVRAANAWSVRQTAREFQVDRNTIHDWMRRLDEGGPDALLQLHEPVNKFPDSMRYQVQRAQTLAPSAGKKKLAELLARLGLHTAVSTIGRIRKEPPHAPPEPPAPPEPEPQAKEKIVTAKYPNHVWHVDLTVLPTVGGMWAPWDPKTYLQLLPFSWWLAFVIDHHSRRVMGFQIFSSQPTSAEVRDFLDDAMRAAQATPKYIISDQGGQFANDEYKSWCKTRDIHPRFGAIGEHGSIAVIERFFRTLKYSLLPGIMIALHLPTLRRTLQSVVEWYNEHRPHNTLKGRTPNEVYFKRFPANRKPRIEPRPLWPRQSRCAAPQVLVAGQPGDRFTLDVDYYHGNRNLPMITLQRCA